MTKLFNHWSYMELRKKLEEEIRKHNRDAEEDLVNLSDCTRLCCEYVAAALEYERETYRSGQMDGPEKATAILQQQDRNRRFTHERAIVSVSAMNRLSEAYGGEQIFFGAPEDRIQVGDFCGELANWLFCNRTR